MAKVQQPSQQQIETARQNRAKDLLQYILDELVMKQQKLYCKVACDFNIFLKVVDWKLGDCINYLARNNWKPTQIVVKLEKTIKKYSPNYVFMANSYGDMTMVTFKMFKQREIEKLKNKININSASITTSATDVTNKAKTDGNGGTTTATNDGNVETKTNEANTDANANVTNLENNRHETVFTQYQITSKLEPDSEDDTIDNN